jgi:hypothetical protein
VGLKGVAQICLQPQSIHRPGLDLLHLAYCLRHQHDFEAGVVHVTLLDLYDLALVTQLREPSDGSFDGRGSILQNVCSPPAEHKAPLAGSI